MSDWDSCFLQLCEKLGYYKVHNAHFSRYFFSEMFDCGSSFAFLSRKLIDAVRSPDEIKSLDLLFNRPDGSAKKVPPFMSGVRGCEPGLLSSDAVASVTCDELRRRMYRLRLWMLALKFTLTVKLIATTTTDSSGTDDAVLLCQYALVDLCLVHNFGNIDGVTRLVRSAVAGDPVQVINAWFATLTGTASERQETKDICLYLIGGLAVLEYVHRVEMPVLGILGDDGIVPAMTFELVADGEGFVRHPLSYLLATSLEFESCFQTVSDYIGISSQKQTVSEDLKLSKRLIRWNLCSSIKTPIHEATGRSICAAIGAGTILAINHETVDPFITVSAAMDIAGNLIPVNLVHKLKRFKKEGGSEVILAQGHQLTNLESFGLVPHTVPDILSVARLITQRSGPRNAYRQAVHLEFGHMPLPGHDAVAPSQLPRIDAMYVDAPLAEEIIAEETAANPTINTQSGASRPPDSHDCRIWDTNILGSRRRPHKVHRSVSIDALFCPGRNRPVMVYGPAGSGKSTLIAYLAWRMSAEDNPLLASDRRVLPAVVQLKDWLDSGLDLATFLAHSGTEIVRRNTGSDIAQPSREHWSKWLSRGDVALLLDGLDQVDTAGVSCVKGAIETHPNCPCLITSRTSSQSRFLAIDEQFSVDCYRVHTPSEFNSSMQLKYIRNYKLNVVKGDSSHFVPEKILEQLAEAEWEGLMARNPLLLSLICLVASCPNGAALPKSRVELYDLFISSALARMWNRWRHSITAVSPQHLNFGTDSSHRFNGGDDNANVTSVELVMKQLRPVLEQAALEFLMRDIKNDKHRSRDIGTYNRLIVFRREELKSVIDAATQGEVWNEPYRLLLLDALVEFSSIIIADGEHDAPIPTRDDARCRFIHLTFQDYLAACALARQVSNFKLDFCDRARRNRMLRRIDRRNIGSASTARRAETREFTAQALLQFLDQQSWVPEWRDVFVMLAGQLAISEDTSCIVPELLTTHRDREDDYFHRQSLATECAVEAYLVSRSRGDYRKLRSLTQRNLRDSFETHWSHIVSGTAPASSCSPSTLRAIVRSSLKFDSASASDTVVSRLCSAITSVDSMNRPARLHAALNLKHLGPTIANFSIVWPTLRTGLQDEQRCVRNSIVEAIAAIYHGAGTAEIVVSLMAALRDEDANLGDMVPGTLHTSGAGAATTDIHAGLQPNIAPTSRTPDSDWISNDSISGSRRQYHLDCFKTFVHTHSMLTEAALALRAVYRELHGEYRLAIINAIEAIYPAHGCSEIVDVIMVGMYSTQSDERRTSAEVLGRIGAIAGDTRMLSTPADSITDTKEEPTGRYAPTEALATSVKAADYASPLSSLTTPPGNEGCENHQSPASGNWSVYPNADTALNGALLERYPEPTPTMREAVEEAGSPMDAVGLDEQLSQAFVAPMVKNQSIEQLATVNSALAKDVEPAPFDEELGSLLSSLTSDVMLTRVRTIQTLGRIYRSAASPEILRLLQSSVLHHDWRVRLAAVETIGTVFQSSAHTQVLDMLVSASSDAEAILSKVATEVIARVYRKAPSVKIQNTLLKGLYAKDWMVRQAAVKSIGIVFSDAGDPAMLAALVGKLRDPDPRVRSAVPEAIGSLCTAKRTEYVIDSLMLAIADDDCDVREAAAQSVHALHLYRNRFFTRQRKTTHLALHDILCGKRAVRAEPFHRRLFDYVSAILPHDRQ